MALIQTDGSGPRRTSLLKTSATVVVVAVLLIGGYWLMTQGPGREILSPAGSTVAQFSGDSDQTTGSFQVREGWAIN